MAKRYTQAEKDEVLAFVEQHNKEHGRGGQTAAKEKFNVNAVTLKAWMDKAGIATPLAKAKKKTAKKKSTKKNVAVSPVAAVPSVVTPKGSKNASALSAKLNKLVGIQAKIDELQAQFDEIKASL